MELPAGTLRMAAGFEVSEDRVRTRAGTGPIGSLSSEDYRSASRDNTAVFAELAIPVLDTLDLSVSVRHDDYSDFGDTTNPQIGFNFTPADWVNIYGHWGESFNAPTALDSLAVSTGRFARASSAAELTNPNVDVFGEYDGEGLVQVILDGSAADLKPQTAESWAVGFNLQPVDGLNISMNYYNIDFVDILGQLAVPDATVRRNNPDKFTWSVTPEQWADVLAQIANPETFDGVIDPENPNADLAYIFDRVTTNFSEAEMSGVDFAVNYTHDTAIGIMSYGLSGNYQRKFDLVQSGVTIDQLEFNPDLNMQAFVGWSRDNVRAKVTVKHTDSFKADSANMQNSVDSLTVTDLFVGYDFRGSAGFTDGLSLRFHIDNVFDEDPPEYRRDFSNVAYSAFTFGRTYKVGLTKTFF
jgi:iron complex outermembrane receptor protein